MFNKKHLQNLFRRLTDLKSEDQPYIYNHYGDWRKKSKYKNDPIFMKVNIDAFLQEYQNKTMRKKRYSRLKQKYSTPQWAYIYCMLMGRRISDMEILIMSKDEIIMLYVKNVIKGRWKSLEEIINDKYIALEYFLYVTKRR